MFEWILNRAAGLGLQGTFLVLLAGRAANEVVGIDPGVREAVLNALKRLVPPRQASIVYQLADAGEVILPFMGYQDGLAEHESGYILDVLAQTNTERSRSMLLEYLEKVDLARMLVDKFLSATFYVNDEDFTHETLKKLKAKRSSFFWKDRPRGRMYIASPKLLRYAQSWPRFSVLVVDGVDGLRISEVFECLEGDSALRVVDLSVCRWQESEWRGQGLREFERLQRISLIGGGIDSVDWLSSFDFLEELVCVNVDLGDFSGVGYASALRRVYACGVSLDAIYSGGDSILESGIELYLGEEDLRELEILERTWGRQFPAWTVVHRWSNYEMKLSVKAVLGDDSTVEAL